MGNGSRCFDISNNEPFKVIAMMEKLWVSDWNMGVTAINAAPE
jgi:hypothetical protein